MIVVLKVPVINKMKNNLRQQLNNRIFFLDGAMGTQLEGHFAVGTAPEILNITNSELIKSVHKKYVQAGSNIISTNTFGANSLKLKGTGHSVEQVVLAAIVNAKSSGAEFVALDIGPTGKILKPNGDLEFETAVDIFKEIIVAGVKNGADVILLETFSCLYELKAAIIAAKENSDLPIIASLTYEANNRTFLGVDALTAVTFLNAVGVDVIGVNCSTSPSGISEIVKTYIKYSKAPVMVMPNAGLPDKNKGYSVSAEDFARQLKKYQKMGVSLFGGCCGTSPEFIKALNNILTNRLSAPPSPRQYAGITSGTKTHIFDNKFTVIGERINPTGKPKLKQALKENDMSFVLSEAILQQQNGAEALDINCGLADIDEVKTLVKVVKEVQAIVDLPLVVDSTNVAAIEAAVRVYNGKPLINSVNGEDESMAKIFPIAKKYGAAVLGLCLDKNGIPQMVKGRLKIAQKIIDTAKQYGIDKNDIIIDPLTLTAAAQQEGAKITLQTVKALKKLKINTTLGLSNISFGLPDRPLLNSTFLTLAIANGLTSAIINPLCENMTGALKAVNVFNNSDKGAEQYIEFCNTAGAGNANPNAANQQHRPLDCINLILSGQTRLAVKTVKDKLLSEKPLDVINNYLVAALTEAGKNFESGKIFLPQLLKTAECAKECCSVVNDAITVSGQEVKQKGKIVLATVKGDIHDIGKNIVKVLLQSYGYQVIDLGKDVEPSEVLNCVIKNDIKLVGLSALMTTTLQGMKDTIQLLKQKTSCRIMVGGAVLNSEYAKQVGADYYAKDALDGVKIADAIFN